MRNLSRISFATADVLLSVIMLFASPLLPLATAATATGRFEVYCDGVGIFLTKIDGAPGELVLFSLVDFPPGTIGESYLGQGKWSEVAVLRGGCVPDGKCESIAKGRVWIEAPGTQETPPKSISGKYEIRLNGKLLEGSFVARKRVRKSPLRLCM
jgi:hypothetical protein